MGDVFIARKGYYCYYFDAIKPGYSGVAIYCRQKPNKITTGLGWPLADQEGRYIQADYPALQHGFVVYAFRH